MSNQTEPIPEAEALRKLERLKPRPLYDWRLWMSIFGILAVLSLMAAVVIVHWNADRAVEVAKEQAELNRVETACRSKIAAEQRDADSAVIRENAVRRLYESAITAGMAQIVVELAEGQRDHTEALRQIEEAHARLAAIDGDLEEALQRQDEARQKNAQIVELCKNG